MKICWNIKNTIISQTLIHFSASMNLLKTRNMC